MKLILLVSILAANFASNNALWCFECVSTQPGCGDPFNWLFLWSNVCKEPNDVCVRITEQLGAEQVITRSCLSSLRGIRRDIPADTYEGCRPAAKDLNLGHYVNNSLKELDIHRNHYESTEFCFCFLDHRCNSSHVQKSSLVLIASGISAIFLFLRF